jgi:Bacterial Ig domain
MKTRLAPVSLSSLLAVMFMTSSLSRTSAATVTTLNDSGPGSLRAAIADAVSGESIHFAVTGAVTLTSGELVISVPLTLDGPGADQLAIRRSEAAGTGAFRIFKVLAPDVVISGVTISNGLLDSGDESDYGGGILNQGDLTLIGCAVVGNGSASKYTRGTGVCNTYGSTLRANGCLFAGNVAAGFYSEGSAIFNFGGLQLTNCTFSGNAAGSSAAIHNDGLASDDVVIESCTVFNNYARFAAGIYNGGSSDSYGGMILVRNSIIAGNIATNADWEFENRDIENRGTIKSGGYNLFGTRVSDVPGFHEILFEIGDRAGLQGTQLHLAPLAENGGPTLTHALYRHSLAVDAGPPSAFPATDQRGVARPQFASCDVGAFEADSFPPNLPPVVSIVAPTNGETRLKSPMFLLAGASDPDGEVVSIEYFEGANSIGTSSNYPIPYLTAGPVAPSGFGYPIIFFPVGMFPAFWDPSPGHYVLTAKATDNDGAVAFSEPIEVTIVGPPIITIKATDPYAAEPGIRKPADAGTFTIRRTGGTNSNLTVHYFVAGTAENGEDYKLIPFSAMIPAGRDSVQIFVNPLDDQVPEETESVCVQLVGPWIPYDVIPFDVPALATNVDQGFLVPPAWIWPPLPGPYQIGTPFKATVYIRDNDGGPKNHRPFVKITQPRNGQLLTRGSSILISADTVDRDGYVEKVEFFDGVKKIGETVINFLVPPPAGSHVSHEFEWSNAPSGLHTLRARATDTNGGVQVSPPVRIWVP